MTRMPLKSGRTQSIVLIFVRLLLILLGVGVAGWAVFVTAIIWEQNKAYDDHCVAPSLAQNRQGEMVIESHEAQAFRESMVREWSYQWPGKLPLLLRSIEAHGNTMIVHVPLGYWKELSWTGSLADNMAGNWESVYLENRGLKENPNPGYCTVVQVLDEQGKQIAKSIHNPYSL
jgi:hypothetical protein